MEISKIIQLTIRYLPENRKEYTLNYPEKTSFLPVYSTILLKTLQVGLKKEGSELTVDYKL